MRQVGGDKMIIFLFIFAALIGCGVAIIQWKDGKSGKSNSIDLELKGCFRKILWGLLWIITIPIAIISGLVGGSKKHRRK